MLCLTLWPHGLWQARLPGPSPYTGICSSSCPLSWWCHPTISSSATPSPLALSLSQHHSLFQWVGFSHQVAKVLDLQLQHQSFPWIFRVDKFDLLVVQGTLKSLLHHHSLEASVLQHSTFFTVQLSHLYMTTGKTIALTRQTFVGTVTSLLFNMLSRFVTAFLPRSKCLLISWLQSPSHVWSPKNSHQIKHNTQLLDCNSFFKLTLTSLCVKETWVWSLG